MKCEEVESLMIDYLDNKLESDKKAEIEKHLETCERCLDEMMEMQHIMQLIASKDMQVPDDSLRINFYHMLHNEIKKADIRDVKPVILRWYDRGIFRVAAAIALLIAGSFLGVLIYSGISNSGQEKELSQLKSEVNALRKTAMFTMLKDGSSSYRIQAVNYADEMDKPDENVINALLMTLNGDKNINVRMAAAYALEKYTSRQYVRDSLVKSLPLQTDPILQVTLINILVELKEKSAIEPIEKIISNDRTLTEVKSVAESGIKHLI
jgi:hypothetical protein